MTKKAVIVALADSNYLDPVKAMFSSVYFNSGWKGDYLLLSHQIPEKKLKWFRDRGIIIKKIKPIDNVKFASWPSTILSKFYLFNEYFKKWSHVIYLDGDIIVRFNIDELLKIEGFAASMDYGHPVKWQFLDGYKKNPKLYLELKKNYNLRKLSFNVGFMVINTSIIKKNTFNDLVSLYFKYKKIIFFPEQAILNIYFINDWKLLNTLYYNTPYAFFSSMSKKPSIKNSNKKLFWNSFGIIIHFIGVGKEYKPWHPKNSFYDDWRNYLKKANEINLSIRPNGFYRSNSYLVLFRHPIVAYYFFLSRFDFMLGQIGIKIREKSPKTYRFIKKVKKFFKK
ncbi:MAG: glycosyltransferase family 8 protein [Candidatus Woesearchaeota archaeon]